MADNSLGSFDFVTLHNPGDRGAPPILPAMDGEIVQRVGVDGTSIQRIGRKGHPFPMRSGVDVQNFSKANTLLRDYLEAQNQQALPLVWGGVNYEAEFGVLYIPVRVEPIRIRRIIGAAGGLRNGDATAWLEALWTLVPIASSP